MKKMKYGIFCFLRFFVRLFFMKPKGVGLDKLPDEPCLVIGNHSQMNGPILGELYFPENYKIWCAAEMCHLREVPAYAFKDFWSKKPLYIRWFFKICSYLIAPLSVIVFTCARTIEVYHDRRAISAIRATLNELKNGNSAIIFPEKAEQRNHIICEFQQGFVDIAKLYYKNTGKQLKFVPMYIAPKLKEYHIGEAVSFNPDNPIAEERERICNYLIDEITSIAVSLPRHKVVPYNNVPKKEYKYNKEND